MSEMLGADLEELRALARDFSGNSQKLVQAQKIIDGAVNQLPRYWQGPDAQRFASQWRGQHRGVISRTAAMLDESADLLKKNAQEQEQASSVASLSGPGGSSGGGGGGGGISGINKILTGNAWGEGYKDGDLGGNIKAATDSGVADLGRAGVGAAALIPGPQQPFAIVAAGAIAIYDNWDKIEDAAQWLGENGPKAVEAVNNFANDVAENTVAAVSDVVENPEKLLPWNW